MSFSRVRIVPGRCKTKIGPIRNTGRPVEGDDTRRTSEETLRVRRVRETSTRLV